MSSDILLYREEKVIFNKKAGFPSFTFLFLMMMLIIVPRDLCSAGGGYNAKTNHTQMSVLCPSPRKSLLKCHMLGMGGRQQGWLGGHARELGGRSCCPMPAMHPSRSSLPPAKLPRAAIPSGGDCCRPRSPHLPLRLHPLCPISIQVTHCSDSFSDLNRSPL